jgi:lipopolysaccharide transport system ATP-binding protein
MSTVIQVDRLGKQYRLGQIGGGRLTDDFNRWLAKLRGKEDPLSPIASIAASARSSRSNSFVGNASRADAIWALKDISFEVKQGEVMGIIGRNGSGKSTALKILSRVTAPTEGEARVKGRIASLLEVGTGFHPELTGRENVYLNGAILGMTKLEIRGKFDEIVAFSEVEQFIDTPVKRYSSGMYVRLAFAVAAHLESEILIVDEVLAVGDFGFQKKCLAKMGSFAQEGKTVLFVSHNMEAVRSLCQRGILLKDGQMGGDGNVDDILQEYSNSLPNQRFDISTNPKYGLTIQSVLLRNTQGQEVSQFCPGEDMVVEIAFDAQKRVERPAFALQVLGINGSCFAANMLMDGNRPEFLVGTAKLECRFRSIPLFPHSYIVRLALWDKNGKDLIANFQDVASFSVVGDLGAYGYKGDFMARTFYATHVVVPYEWRLPNGTTATVSLSPPSR